MQNHTTKNDDKEPLDPQVEKIRRKMIRLLSVSLAIMFVGIIAVLIAIFYKINSSSRTEILSEKSAPVMVSDFAHNREIILPANFKIKNFDLDGHRGAFHGVGLDGVAKILIIDLRNGKILSTIVLGQ